MKVIEILRFNREIFCGLDEKNTQKSAKTFFILKNFRNFAMKEKIKYAANFALARMQVSCKFCEKQK